MPTARLPQYLAYIGAILSKAPQDMAGLDQLSRAFGDLLNVADAISSRMKEDEVLLTSTSKYYV